VHWERWPSELVDAGGDGGRADTWEELNSPVRTSAMGILNNLLLQALPFRSHPLPGASAGSTLHVADRCVCVGGYHGRALHAAAPLPGELRGEVAASTLVCGRKEGASWSLWRGLAGIGAVLRGGCCACGLDEAVQGHSLAPSLGRPGRGGGCCSLQFSIYCDCASVMLMPGVHGDSAAR
jgi:hypothetical protein